MGDGGEGWIGKASDFQLLLLHRVDNEGYTERGFEGCTKKETKEVLYSYRKCALIMQEFVVGNELTRKEGWKMDMSKGCYKLSVRAVTGLIYK